MNYEIHINLKAIQKRYYAKAIPSARYPPVVCQDAGSLPAAVRLEEMILVLFSLLQVGF